ncbi:MAG: hypothetical protein PHC98_05370 [Syntrophotalea acetylenica]|nr:hypothetical protein [Syntrophotalea acetylenica]
MRISIDGGRTFVDRSKLRICLDNLSEPAFTNYETPVSLCLTATPEGIIRDVVDAEGEVLATSSMTAQETVEQLFDAEHQALRQQILQHEVEALRKGLAEAAQGVLDACRRAVDKCRSLDNINLDYLIDAHIPRIRIQTEGGYIFERQEDQSWTDGDMTFSDLSHFDVRCRLLTEGEANDEEVCPR